MATDRNRPICTGTRKDGTACTAVVLVDGSHCFAHAPGNQQGRDEARRKGGRSRSNQARLARLMPAQLVSVYQQLDRALADTLAGELDPRTATAAATLGRALVSVLQAGEMEARLRALEEATPQSQARGWRA